MEVDNEDENVIHSISVAAESVTFHMIVPATLISLLILIYRDTHRLKKSELTLRRHGPKQAFFLRRLQATNRVITALISIFLITSASMTWVILVIDVQKYGERDQNILIFVTNTGQNGRYRAASYWAPQLYGIHWTPSKGLSLTAVMYFTIISWVASILQICFFTLGLAAALYYMAELVEEYTAAAAKVIRSLILIVIGIHVGFLMFEDVPTSLSVIGIVSQIVNLALMSSFPGFEPLSPSFIASVVLVIIQHYMTFNYFGESYHEFSEIIAYFTICLWTIPFAFFVSLSANDQVLPTLSAQSPHGFDMGPGNSNDVVSNYFSKSRNKKYGLLTFFNYAKDTLFPSQQKRFK